MDQETIRYCDDGYIGDVVLVEYLVGMHRAIAEGEFAGFVRTRRGNWFLHLSGVMLIPTMDILSIRVLSHAGCL